MPDFDYDAALAQPSAPQECPVCSKALWTEGWSYRSSRPERCTDITVYARCGAPFAIKNHVQAVYEFTRFQVDHSELPNGSHTVCPWCQSVEVDSRLVTAKGSQMSDTRLEDEIYLRRSCRNCRWEGRDRQGQGSWTAVYRFNRVEEADDARI